MAEIKPQKKRSLLTLLTDVPTLVRELVQGEIELFKSEMIAKLKALGIGAGILAAAALVLLLVVAGILGLIGYRKLKKGIPPVPTETIHGLKKDLNAIKGIGKRATAGAEQHE